MKLSRWTLPVALVFGLAACPSDDDGVPDAEPDPDPDPDAEEPDPDPDPDAEPDDDVDPESGFIDDYDDEWDDQELTEGDWYGDDEDPHNEVRIWYSDNLWNEVDAYLDDNDNNIEAAEGDVAVKRSREEGETDYTVVVMTKQGDDYDPDWNNWYYEVYEQDDNDGYDYVASGDSDFEPEGPDSNCASCHDNVAGDNDYIAGPESIELD